MLEFSPEMVLQVDAVFNHFQNVIMFVTMYMFIW